MVAEKWNKKVDYFTKSVTREVNTRKRKAKHQLANRLSAEFSVGISAAEKKVQNFLDEERRQIARYVNRQVSEVQFAERLRYVNKRDACATELFEEVRADLLAFVDSAEYEVYLLERIKIAAQMHDFAVVRLTPRDMCFAEGIEAAANLTAEEGEADYIGGFVLLTENRKTQADYTFKARLAEQKSKPLEVC